MANRQEAARQGTDSEVALPSCRITLATQRGREMYDPQSIETILADVIDAPYGSVAPPIVQSSLFTFENYRAFEERIASCTNQPLYTRGQNPTVAAFEALMAKAERAEASVGVGQTLSIGIAPAKASFFDKKDEARI